MKLRVLVIVSLFLLAGCGTNTENAEDVSNEINNSLDAANGLTAIQYNFGIACDRIRAGVFEGTADLFREAGTMGEEDGDLDLARIAYQYADSLDNYNQNETFSECQNF